MVGQIGGSAEGLSATAGGSGRLEHKGGCAAAPKHWRLRLPGNALIESGFRLGLLEEIPVRHRRGSIVPGGWVSCAEAANDRTRMVRAGTQAEQDSAAQGRAGVISGGRGGSPNVCENPLDGCGLGDECNQAHVCAAVGAGQGQRLEQRP